MIDRYDWTDNAPCQSDYYLEPTAEGEWCKYDEHAEALAIAERTFDAQHFEALREAEARVRALESELASEKEAYAIACSRADVAGTRADAAATLNTEQAAHYKRETDRLAEALEAAERRGDEIHGDMCAAITACAQQNERLGIAEQQLAAERTLHNKTGGMLVDTSKSLMRERLRAEAAETRARELEECNRELARHITEANGRVIAAEAMLLANKPAAPAGFQIRFDGPPGQECGRFVECETLDGNSISIGRWVQDGEYWLLVVDNQTAAPAREDDSVWRVALAAEQARRELAESRLAVATLPAMRYKKSADPRVLGHFVVEPAAPTRTEDDPDDRDFAQGYAAGWLQGQRDAEGWLQHKRTEAEQAVLDAMAEVPEQTLRNVNPLGDYAPPASAELARRGLK